VSRNPPTPPVPPPSGTADGSDRANTITAPIANTTASTGKANRSKACTRLCPKNATPICTSTTTTRHAAAGTPVSESRAKAALTLFTANHPNPDVIVISAAGTALPR
jgi:hypothetical protein